MINFYSPQAFGMSFWLYKCQKGSSYCVVNFKKNRQGVITTSQY